MQDVAGSEATAGILEIPDVKQAEVFLRHLSAAARNIRFYPAGHAVVKASIAAVHSSALSLLRERPEISVGLIGEEWMVHNTLLHKATSVATDLKERLRERNLTSITLQRGLAEGDFQALINLLTTDPESVKKTGAAATLRGLGAKAVLVGHLAASTEEQEAELSADDATGPLDVSAAALLQCSAAAIAELYSEALEGSMDLNGAKSMLSDIVDLVGSEQASLKTLMDIRTHDDYTYTHVVNVCVLTLAQARRLNLNDDTLDEIGLAALMHDVGKQRIPVEIIRKPTRLTAEEFEIMKKHTVYGAELLRSMPGAPDLAAMVAFEHHLRYDCTGYPTIGRRRSLNLCTYLTMIADAFDAMRTLRPYSKKMPQQEVAIRLEADVGTHFEPSLLEIFFRVLDPIPCGSKVKLSSGEDAVVLGRTGRDYMKPVVKTIRDSSGMELDDGREIDLAQERGPSPIRITATPDGETEGGD